MTTKYSLRDLGLSTGQARHEEIDLALQPYKQGGEKYAAATPTVPAKLDITAMQEGYDFRLRFTATLAGPCARCLEPAGYDLDIDAHEVHVEGASDDDLVSVHVDNKVPELDVSGWARELIGLEFPVRVLCTEECKGLCPVCGCDRNKQSCECVIESRDSRWDALKELKFDDE